MSDPNCTHPDQSEIQTSNGVWILCETCKYSWLSRLKNNPHNGSDEARSFS